jgi:cold shock CspA family protein
MGRSQETSNKKEVRSKQDKKRKDKEKKRLIKKDGDGGGGNMIAYVDEFGMISSTPPDVDRRKHTKLEDIEISIPKRDSSQKSDPIRKGIVTYFNDSKGFGFIRDLESQDSVFAHINNFQEEIQQDNVVSFEVENGPRGPAAVNVRIYRAPVAAPAVVKVAAPEADAAEPDSAVSAE